MTKPIHSVQTCIHICFRRLWPEIWWVVNDLSKKFHSTDHSSFFFSLCLLSLSPLFYSSSNVKAPYFGQTSLDLIFHLLFAHINYDSHWSLWPLILPTNYVPNNMESSLPNYWVKLSKHFQLYFLYWDLLGTYY